MPTSTERTYTSEEQAARVLEYRALADCVLVWEDETAVGRFEVRRGPDGYYLTDDGLRIFGLARTFDSLPLMEAVDDADAVRLAKSKVVARLEREVTRLLDEWGLREYPTAAPDVAEAAADFDSDDTPGTCPGCGEVMEDGHVLKCEVCWNGGL